VTAEPETPRQYLAAQFRTDHEAWDVRDWPAEPTRLGKGEYMVSIWRSDLRPTPGVLGIEHELTVHVYGPKATYSAATETELDTLIDDVLLSVERLKGAHWTSAKRQNFCDDAFTGFEVMVTMISGNHYRKKINEERALSHDAPAA
jgi:hypothetical protein